MDVKVALMASDATPSRPIEQVAIGGGAEAGDAQRLDDPVSTLTEAGCLICPLPPSIGPVNGNGLWQPAQEDQT
jgi:hypothetical protein